MPPEGPLLELVPMVCRVVFPTSSVKYWRSSASPSFMATLTPQFARIFFRPSRSPYLLSWEIFWTAPIQNRSYERPRLRRLGRHSTFGRFPHSSPRMDTVLGSFPPTASAMEYTAA